MSAITTVAELAEQLGVNKSTISRHVARLGLGTRIANMIALSKQECRQVERAIVDAKPGNPNAARDGAMYGGANSKKRRKK